MADEGTSSSSNSVDGAEDKQEKKPAPFASSFTSNTNESCATVSSSHMGSASQVFLLGKEGGNTISNPFAVKPAAPTRSVADSTDNKETRPLLAPPTLKLGNPPEPPKIVLRPSALSAQAEKLKILNKCEESNTKQDEGKENSSEEGNVAKIPRLSTNESNGKISKSEMFASGISTSTTVTSSIPSSAAASAEGGSFSMAPNSFSDQSSKGSFVFGQNLHKKALNYESLSEQPPSSPPDSHSLTFKEAALKKEELEQMEQQNQEEKMKTLSESAKEYESKQVKRKFDEVTVVTGEEEESNVLQINCKLFAFDKVGMNWLERGRGMLRLNDKESSKGERHSRVVMRTQGSLRVILNTKVWAGMTIEHPSKKTVRLTAYDPQGVKVFLVMAQPKDIDKLFHALDWRVAALKTQENESARQEQNSECTTSLEEATSSSSVLEASFDDSCDNSDKNNKGSTSSESECFRADSSSETSFVAQDSSHDSALDGVADSTNTRS